MITRIGRDHITGVLMDLHWLPIVARIDYKVLLFVYKALNGIGPSYLSDLLHLKQRKRSTRSSEDCLMLAHPKPILRL